MALNVQFYKVTNALINEDIVVPRLVNQQSLDFNAMCDYLADGSTVTAADVAAVMKQIETRLPLVLGLNAKVVCSPEGLVFRPRVSGSITQSQLKKKLEAKLAADPTLDIDVNRALQTSDLSTDGTGPSGSQNQGDNNQGTNTGGNTGGNTGENTGGGNDSGSGDDDERPGVGG